jgi:hypothetical protein
MPRFLDSKLHTTTVTSGAIVMAKLNSRETLKPRETLLLVLWLKNAPSYFISRQCTRIPSNQKNDRWKVWEIKTTRRLEERDLHYQGNVKATTSPILLVTWWYLCSWHSEPCSGFIKSRGVRKNSVVKTNVLTVPSGIKEAFDSGSNQRCSA